MYDARALYWVYMLVFIPWQVLGTTALQGFLSLHYFFFEGGGFSNSFYLGLNNI